jgi:AraC-like DNA-binding protein
MSCHGYGVREASDRGSVVVSRVRRGISQIQAMAPSIKYVLEGEVVYTIGGRTKRLRAGEFLLAEGGGEFVGRTSGGMVGLCIYLGCPEGRAVGDALHLSSPVLSGTALDPFARLLEGHARRLSSTSELQGDAAGQVLRDIAAGVEEFLSRFERQGESLRSARKATRVETMQRLERARAYIHENGNRAVTLEEIAAVAALSRFHLVRSFSDLYGVSPLAYHRELRLERAVQQLRHEYSPSEVAAGLGYGSLSAFTRAFQRKYGHPPSLLRQAS